MKFRRPRLRFRYNLLFAVLTATTLTPVLANTPNFGKINLAPGFEAAKGTVSGYTGGSYSLSGISNRDRDRNLCLGFADPNPDHVLVLEKDFAKLKILVNSGGKDTTIVVTGPDDKTVRCGDDTGQSKDASVNSQDWKAGTYKIWVGTFNQNTKLNYTLRIQE